MTTSNFQAEDWVYVPDGMGRLGQGYYKNINNPNETITSAEFEKRRSQPVSVQSKNKEQNINSMENTAPLTSDKGLLSDGDGGASTLTPWDNPVIGEQAAEASAQKPKEVAKAEIKQPIPTAQEVQRKPVEKAADPDAVSKDNDRKGGSENSGTGGGEGAAKVVCTELVRQGLMSEKDRRACTFYAFSRLPPSFMLGYHFWAVPYVRLMRRSKLATRLITPIVNHRTREIRARLGLQKTGSWFGKAICALHDPLCNLMGRWVHPAQYDVLYKEHAAAS